MRLFEIITVAVVAILAKSLFDRTKKLERNVDEIYNYLEAESAVEELINSVEWGNNYN